MGALLTLDDVVRFYGPVQALGPVTLEVPEGSVGLLGPNGAGKSTLLRLAVGLLEPTDGEIRLLGEEPGHGGHRQVGYVPEGEARFPGRTGVENGVHAARLTGLPRSDAMERTHQMLDYVGLEDERYRQVGTYSSGMRQRLKLAQALVHDPELLVLDEPTEGIDPEGRLQMLDLLTELRDDHGIDLLVSTHLLADVERLAERVVLLEDGDVAAQGPLDELRSVDADAHEVTLVEGRDSFTDVLEKEGVPWEEDGSGLRVEAGDPQQILAWARQADAVVRDLEPTEQGLAEVLFDRVDGAGPGPASGIREGPGVGGGRGG